MLEARARPGAGVVREGTHDGGPIHLAQAVATDGFTRGTAEPLAARGLLDAPRDGSYITEDGFEYRDGVFQDGVSPEAWVEQFGPGLSGVHPEHLEYAFGNAMRDTAFDMLNTAEAGTWRQQDDVAGASEAAVEIRVLRDQILELERGACSDNAVSERRALEAELAAHTRRFPMLQDLSDGRLMQIADPEQAEARLAERGEEVRTGIETTRNNLRDGSFDPYKSKEFVEAAAARLGLEPGTPEYDRILAHQADTRWEDTQASLARVGVGVGLAALGFATGGPVGAAAGVAASGVGAVDTAIEVDNYMVDSAAHLAGRGDADATLLSDEEMRNRELLLALSLAGAGTDVLGLPVDALRMGRALGEVGTGFKGLDAAESGVLDADLVKLRGRFDEAETALPGAEVRLVPPEIADAQGFRGRSSLVGDPNDPTRSVALRTD